MTQEPQTPAQKRFEAAIQLFDQANSADPNIVEFNGSNYPRELLYSRWLSEWVQRLGPEASEALLLAARSQHLCRWQIPRDSFPMNRAGYLQWRSELKRFHADKSGEVLRQLGYAEEFVNRVQDLNLKRYSPGDVEAQTLEDALCLVFLERQLDSLAERSTDDKILNALQKSWAKMSPEGRTQALKLKLGTRSENLLARALRPLEENSSSDSLH